MRVRLDNPSFIEDLVDFLQKAECDAQPASADTVEVQLQGVSTGEAARVELGFYLGVWSAMHPGVSVEQLA